MYTPACLRRAVLLLPLLLVPGLHAEQGLLTFVFGPSSPEGERQSARAAAATARHWMQTAGNMVELRRAGSPDVQPIDAAMDSKKMEQTLMDAVLAAREADPPSFLLTLDAAAQATAAHSGTRVVVAVLNSPSFSSDGERAMENLGQICQAHGVRILVLDLADDAKHVPSTALKALVAKTGGAWVRQAKDLEPQVAMVTPPDETAVPPAPPAPAAAPAKAAEGAASAGDIPFAIPVSIRLMRTSGTGSTSESIMDREADFGQSFTLSAVPGGTGPSLTGGGGSMEVSYCSSA